MHSSVANEGESESVTKKPTEEKIRQNHEVEWGLRVGGDVGGTSANASTRSLAGSRIVTPGTSLSESGDTSGGYSQTPLPEVPGPSSGTTDKEKDAGSTKTGEIGVEKSPHLGQIHMSSSPVTTGREYPLSLDEEKELGETLSEGGLEEKLDSTHDHMMKGKVRQSRGTPMTSAGPHSTATGAYASSAQTNPTTTSQEPTRATIPTGTTTSDTTSGATPPTTKSAAASDISLAHKTDSPPKKSKHGFFEKLKIKFESKERRKGKN